MYFVETSQVLKVCGALCDHSSSLNFFIQLILYFGEVCSEEWRLWPRVTKTSDCRSKSTQLEYFIIAHNEYYYVTRGLLLDQIYEWVQKCWTLLAHTYINHPAF